VQSRVRSTRCRRCEAAIVAMPDERLGERACAFVVRARAPASHEDMRAFLADRAWPAVLGRSDSRSSSRCHARRPGKFRSSSCVRSKGLTVQRPVDRPRISGETVHAEPMKSPHGGRMGLAFCPSDRMPAYDLAVPCANPDVPSARRLGVRHRPDRHRIPSACGARPSSSSCRRFPRPDPSVSCVPGYGILLVVTIP